MTATERLIPLTARDEWQQALAGIPHAFAHTWDSCYAMWLTTAAPTYLYEWVTERGRAVCPFAERSFRGHTDIFTPYGFSGFAHVGDRSGLNRSWSSFAARRGYICGFMGMNPILADTEAFAAGDAHEYNDLYVLDLTYAEEALFARLSQNRKREVRAARRGAPRITTDAAACRRFLVAQLPHFYQQKRASDAYRFSTDTLQHLLGYPRSFLVGAEDHEGVQAVCLFLYTAHVGEYFAGVSTAAGRAASAALLWHGALELKRRGVPLLNLGGGVSRGDGVARFKERFGALKLPLRALKQVYRNDMYRDLCRTAGADPIDRSGFFPPYQRARAGVTSAPTAEPTSAGARETACS